MSGRPLPWKTPRWLTATAVIISAAAVVTGSGALIDPDAVPVPELGEPVPVLTVNPGGIDLAATGYGGDGRVWTPPAVTWPTGGGARLSIDGTARRAGDLPVELSTTGASTSVEVSVADRAATAASGVDGLLVRLSSPSNEPVRVGLGYAAFAGAYGGSWASRLRLVATDGSAPVDVTNDLAAQKVSATLVPNGTYALMAGTGSQAGSFAATDLEAAGSWSAGSNSGGFSYSYPLRVPPAAGPVPEVSLSYSSQAHDGRTSGSNNQASWVGDGWDYEPGYIERTFTPCAGDQDGGNNTAKTADRCWDGESNSLTVSLNGRTTTLLKDDTTGVWRGASDDGWRVEKLGAKATSSQASTESWLITTTDGMKFTFGASAATRWTVPVFGNHTGEACHATAFKDSWCQQAYRWQLEKVVDVHGNQASYVYETETGHYGAAGDAANRVSFVRGGHLARIDYGLRASDSSVKATARVVFTTGERCLGDCGTASAPNAANWPDTPLDQECSGQTCTGLLSPAFFSSARLLKVTTQVAEGAGFKDVDSWALTHEFKDYGDKSQVVMWLKSIQHTGLVGTAITLPPTTFEGQSLPNRVETGTGIPAIWRTRLTAITTESGGVIGISYSAPDCATGDLPAAESNSRRCYPVWWTPKDYWEPQKDWFRKYVVTSVTEQDTTAGSGYTKTAYEYSTDGGGTTALWAWDDGEFTDKKQRTYSQWRGYAQVTTKVGDPAQGAQLITRSRFHRGMDGQPLPGGGKRTVALTDAEGGTVTDHEALAGSVYETAKFDGARLDSAEVSRYWTKNTATRQHDGGSTKAWMTAESEKSTRRWLSGSTWQRTKTVTSYDARGRAVSVDDLGDTSTAADDKCVRTDYVADNPAWLLDLVAQVETVSVSCGTTPNRPAHVVNEARTYYDGLSTLGAVGSRGLSTRTETLTEWKTAPVRVTTATMTYDDLGRTRTKTDALGRTTTTTFVPAGPGPKTGTTEVNALGHTTTTTLEPAWGVETMTVDANGRKTERTYDGLGRALAVWLPGQNRPSALPNQRFSYNVATNAPSTVVSEKLTPRLTYQTSVAYYDSLLRKIGTQNATPVGGRLLLETAFNTRGEVAYESGPNYDNTGTPGSGFVRVDPGADHTRTVYVRDGLGRTLTEEFWSKNVHKWDTTYAYGGETGGFLTVTTPPSGGIRTGVLEDARGQATEKRQYRADGGYTSVRYTYTPAEKLATVSDDAGNVWRNEYDLRGNQTLASDPDSGTSTLTYDLNGRPVTRTDARGITVTTVYDEIGRTSATWKGAAGTGVKLTDYTYDSLTGGVGLLTASRSYVDGTLAVTSRIGKYDVAGRPTQHYTDIAAIPGLTKLAGSYLYTTVYTVDGQIGGMGYAGYGGLDPESIAYGYSTFGAPTTMIGTNAVNGIQQSYVGAASYTAYGEKAQRTFGDVPGKRAYETYTYEDGTRRRLKTIISADGLTSKVADLDYTYDDAGNIRSINDVSERQCFTYDDLRQLSEAWTQDSGTDCSAGPSTAVMGGDTPYWSSYRYGATGNRESETRHGTAGESVQGVYAYPGGKTHLASSVTKGQSVENYTYDPAGHLSTRRTETLTWDARGKLAAIDNGAQKTRMIYDADGTRVARIDPSGDVTVFAGQTEITYKAATDTISAVRSYTHNGDVIAVRSSADGLVWTGGDHHGTMTWTVTAMTMVATNRRMDPFGNDRGPAVAWKGGQRGFVGGIEDPNGFVNIGARPYDPETGRFIAPDPMCDFTDPQQINGYTYANGNPVTYSDPTGLMAASQETEPGGAAAPEPAGLVEVPTWLLEQVGEILSHLVEGAEVTADIIAQALTFLGRAIGALKNLHNGSTITAIVFVLIVQEGDLSGCSFVSAMVVCTGMNWIPHVGSGSTQPMTVGDVFLYPYSQKAFDDRLDRERREREYIQANCAEWNICDDWEDYAPDLMAHEEEHAFQWSLAPNAVIYAAVYLSNGGLSDWFCDDPALCSLFEQDANLYKGSYVDLPDVGTGGCSDQTYGPKNWCLAPGDSPFWDAQKGH